jgi:hypothetical protein
MFDALRRSKLVRTLVLALVAGFVALLAFAAANAVGLQGVVGTIVAVAVGLATGLALESALGPTD